MDEDKQGFLVTPRMMYDKLQEINIKVTVLMERDHRDNLRIEDLEKSTKWLQRAVYAIGIPVVALISGYEAITRLMS